MQFFFKLFMDWLSAKVIEFFGGLVRLFKRRKEVEKQAEESVKPLKEAQSAEEIDKSSDAALGGF